MRVAVLCIVVDVSRVDIGLDYLECLRHVSHHVSVPGIEADSHIVKVGGANELNQALWRGKLVGNVFKQHPHSQRLGKSPQMLDRGHRCFELALIKGFVRDTYVLNQKTEWNLLG